MRMWIDATFSHRFLNWFCVVWLLLSCLSFAGTPVADGTFVHATHGIAVAIEIVFFAGGLVGIIASTICWVKVDVDEIGYVSAKQVHRKRERAEHWRAVKRAKEMRGDPTLDLREANEIERW